MLIHDPHDLTGVHCGTAAHGNDYIGLEGCHLGGAGLGAGEAGIGSHIIEGGVLDAHFVQLLLNGLGVTIVVQEGVRDKEGLFLAHNGLQLIQSDAQAALLDVDLLGSAEPEHVFPSFCHSLDVQQVLDTHVFRNGVAAPGAAA